MYLHEHLFWKLITSAFCIIVKTATSKKRDASYLSQEHI